MSQKFSKGGGVFLTGIPLITYLTDSTPSMRSTDRSLIELKECVNLQNRKRQSIPWRKKILIKIYIFYHEENRFWKKIEIEIFKIENFQNRNFDVKKFQNISDLFFKKNLHTETPFWSACRLYFFHGCIFSGKSEISIIIAIF